MTQKNASRAKRIRSGILLAAALAGMEGVLPARALGQLTFLNAWGSSGTGNGQLNYPVDIAVGTAGTVYVADNGNNRVETFSSTGAFQSTFGSSGTGNGEFDGPDGVAVGPTGTVYVTDHLNNRVETFSSIGTFQSTFGSSGTGNGEFDGPTGVAVGPSGTVYVVDSDNNRVETFSSTGAFQSTFGSSGTGNAEFSNPIGVAAGPTGTVYVADDSNERVETFSSTGAFQSTFGSAGSGSGEFNDPDYVAVGPTGTVYVVEYYNDRVDAFSSNGTFQSTFGSYGSGNGQFMNPTGVAVSPTGMVYVTDTMNDRVERLFDPNSWVSGTNTFTDPTVGPTSVGVGGSSLLGDNLTLNSAMGLVVGGTLSVGGFGTLTQAGASVSSGSLTLSPYGTYNYQSGAHDFTSITVDNLGFLTGNPFTVNAAETLSLTGGVIGSSILTIAANSSATQTGGTLSSPVLNLQGFYSYMGGTFTPGSVTIQAGGQLQQNDTSGLTNSSVIQLFPGSLIAGGSGYSVTNTAAGQITGGGTITAPVTNNGTIEPSGGVLTFTAAVTNSGSIILPYNSEGLFYNFASNSGTVSLSGGTFNNNGQALSNTGQILGFGILQTGVITNSSSATLALAGQSSVYGPVTSNSGALIHLSGNTPNVFYGAVANNGTLTIDTGASGTIYGAYTGSGKIIDNGSLYLNAASVAGPISGNGNLTIGSTSSGPAVVQLAQSSGISTLASLTLSTGSALDLTNNLITIDYGSGPDPITSIAAWIKSGYNGGAWDGTGIISTNAQTNGRSYGIGYADSADPGNPAGLAPGTIEIAYTLLGDANLDGKVNGTDFNLMATNFNQAVTNGWDKGDFNYDGKVNGNDFVLLADNFNEFASQSAVSAADLAALDNFAIANGISLVNVPEPASAAWAVVAGLGILRRRRRSSPYRPSSR